MTTGIILSARAGRPVAAVPIQEMRCLLADIIVDEAFSLRCEPTDPKLVDAIIGLMMAELGSTYSSWRVDEIRIAVRAGTCSQLGPMYRLSPAEFIRIMKVYNTCPLRLEALRQIRREKEKPQPEDPETIARKNRETHARVARECLADVKACGHITYYSDQTLANVLNHLVTSGIVKAEIGNTDTGTARLRLEKILRDMIAAGETQAIEEFSSSGESQNTRI